MSQMVMFVIEKNGDLREFATFPNAYRGWKIMWDFFEAKYFPVEPGKASILIEDALHPERKAAEKFWNLAYEARVPAHERVALRCSYDGAMLKQEHFQLASDSFYVLADEMGKTPWMERGMAILGEEVTFVADSGNMGALADAIGKAKKQENLIGCCWQYSSSSSDPWNEGRAHRGGRPFNVFVNRNYVPQYWINPSCLESDDLPLEMKEDE